MLKVLLLSITATLFMGTKALPFAASSVAATADQPQSGPTVLSWLPEESSKVWQRLQQQRLNRVSALMHDLQSANSAALLEAQLSRYAAVQRPLFAVQDMQQLMHASTDPTAAEVADLQYIGQSLYDFGGSSSSNVDETLDNDLPDLPDDTLLLHTLPPYETGGDDLISTIDTAVSVSLGSTVYHAKPAGNTAQAGSTPTGQDVHAADLLPAASRKLKASSVSISVSNSGSNIEPVDLSWVFNGVGGSASLGRDEMIKIKDLSLDQGSDESASDYEVHEDSRSDADGSSTAHDDQADDGAVHMPAVTKRSPRDYRIIGGVEAPKDRYSWVASLRSSTDFHFCAGTLIAPSVVLTAAHCLNQQDPSLSMPWIEIGRYYLSEADQGTTATSYDRIKCAKSVVHPNWSFDTGLYDIAMCFLEEDSRFTPVTLVQAGGAPKPNTPVTVMGWGAPSEDAKNAPKLMQVTVDVTALATCNETYKGAVRDTQICAGVPEGGRDACQGDSGGPLILPGETAGDDVQVGIVSYGIGCGRPNTPGVYTDISKYRTYITSQLLRHGVRYAPVTGDEAAAVSATQGSTTTSSTSSSTSSSDPCSCTNTGYSGDAYIGRTLTGCKQHGLDIGDASFYCYAVGGRACMKATASNAYPGAAWVTCGADAQQQTTPVSSTAGSSSIGGWIQSLQNWITFNAAANSTAGSSSSSSSSASGGSPVPVVRHGVMRSAATAASAAGRR